jgi:hypothetical protein
VATPLSWGLSFSKVEDLAKAVSTLRSATALQDALRDTEP